MDDVRIGFAGLGRMGGGMASRLAQRNGGIGVYDPDGRRVEVLAREGARPAGSLAELVADSDVLFTSLPGPPQLEKAIFAEGGILSAMRPGLTLVDLSTVSVDLVRRAARSIQAAGGAMLDAPVSGGPAGAASGDLALWVGGERSAFVRHEPLLRSIGDKTAYVGPSGAGTAVKLVHNLLGYSIMQALAEGFSLGVKTGLDPLDLWEALKLGAVGRTSPLNLLRAQFLPGTYDPPAFALDLALKDVRLATALAAEADVELPVAELTLAEMSEAVARGWGGQDSRSFLKLQLERAGVTVAVSADRLAASERA